MVTSPGPNTIVCKQLQPSHGTSLLSVADVANMDAVAWKFVEAEEEPPLLQMLTTLQTSCWVHTTPVVVESEAIVV